MEIKNSSDLRHGRTEKLLHDAFLCLFRTKPYESIHISDIVRVAGVNRATFYTHYKSKEQLLGSFIRDGWKIVCPSDQRMEEMDGEELLGHLVQTAVDFTQQNPRLTVVALREMLYSPYMADTYTEVVESVIRLLRHSLKEHAPQEDQQRFAAQYIVHGVYSCFISYFEKKNAMTNDE